MIPIGEALDLILGEVKPLGHERVPLLSSLGRVLAEDIAATISNPPLDNSAMDGYAVRAADTAGAADGKPVSLKVIADLPAGNILREKVGTGEAVRIMTGAPVPDGADAVVMVEYTEKVEAGGVKSVAIAREASLGDNVRRAGEDFKVGDAVIEKGRIIRPAEVAMMAATGKPFVTVYQRPRVAVLSTGDELVDIYETPTDGKIINSNSYTISAQLLDCGCEAIQLGIARDTREDLEEKMRSGLNSDAIISSGGVSVGDFDFVKEVLRDMGSEMHFWKVAMKPGKPLAFGTIGGKPAFGLPGNPISSMVSFEQFVRPALLKMAGRRDIFKRSIAATLAKDVKKKAGRVNFVRAILAPSGDGFTVTPLEGQGSGIISSMVKANALILLPLAESSFQAGQEINVHPLDESLLYSDRPSDELIS
ncbi:MAG: gephyrin-like molybdotransferase Glp [Thermodesulfobacteriota bacterium]